MSSIRPSFIDSLRVYTAVPDHGRERISMTRRKFLLANAAAAVLASYPTLGAAADLRAIARDAYLYVLPLLEMAAMRQRLLAMGASQNTIYHRRNLADASSRLVTSPNNDTLYSTAWLDLTAGPVTAILPDVGRRYFSLQLMDMYTNNFTVLGTRTTGSCAAKFTIVGPNDAIGALERSALRSPTPHVWALGRVLVDGPDDLDAARTVQAGILVDGPKVTAKPRRSSIGAVTQDARWQDIFAEANLLLAEDRPPVTDRAMLSRIAALGVSPNATFNPNAFSDAEREAIAAGVADGRALVIDPRNHRPAIQGWYYPGPTLGIFGQDYRTRAVVAHTELAALPRDEAMYMRAEGTDGDALYDGRKMWRIHFAPGQLPPVSGFWSLTMYERTPDGQSFFIKNPLKRYAIGNRTPGLKTDADGALDLWIGHDDPGPDRASNWLPAPAGSFTMTLRAYLPAPSLLNGDYKLPRVTPAD
jgi:hypothetical protein